MNFHGDDTKVRIGEWRNNAWHPELETTLGEMREANADDPVVLEALALLGRGRFTVQINAGAGGKTQVDVQDDPGEIGDGEPIASRPPIGWDRWGRMADRSRRATQCPALAEVYALLRTLPFEERRAAALRGAEWCHEGDPEMGGRWGDSVWVSTRDVLTGYARAVAEFLVLPPDQRWG